eukprot:TRINITY_DN7654_c0_g1_i1.p1 TRINITY_DN7654_c0_g1~~TRINITY_DN7654_c0_g1_i1.p1  ORF type:complete len:603 (+),score=61.91 TRINITY_DN7654_c0_g1_i1:38-1810(+)
MCTITQNVTCQLELPEGKLTGESQHFNADILSLIIEFATDDVYYLGVMRAVCAQWSRRLQRCLKSGRGLLRVRVTPEAAVSKAMQLYPAVPLIFDLSQCKASFMEVAEALLLSLACRPQVTVWQWQDVTKGSDWFPAWQRLVPQVPRCAEGLLVHALLNNEAWCAAPDAQECIVCIAPYLTPEVICRIVRDHPGVMHLYPRLSGLLTQEQRQFFARSSLLCDGFELAFSAPNIDVLCTDAPLHFVAGAFLTKGLVVKRVLKRSLGRFRCSQFPSELHRLLPLEVECVHETPVPRYQPPFNTLGTFCDIFISTHGSLLRKAFHLGDSLPVQCRWTARRWLDCYSACQQYAHFFFTDWACPELRMQPAPWGLQLRQNLLRRLLVFDFFTDDASSLSRQILEVSSYPVCTDELRPTLEEISRVTLLPRLLHGENLASVLVTILKELDTRDCERNAFRLFLSDKKDPTHQDIFKAFVLAQETRRTCYSCAHWKAFAASHMSPSLTELHLWFHSLVYGGLTLRTHLAEEEEQSNRCAIEAQEAAAFAEIQLQIDTIEDMLLCQKWYREQVALMNTKREIHYDEWWDPGDDSADDK